MSYTTDYNLGKIPAGAVDWIALLNDAMDKIEAGRTLKLQAGETLAIRDPFYIQSGDGKAYKADNTTEVHGVWQSTSTAGDAYGYGQIGGTMTYGSWAWTKTAKLFVSAGKALTETATPRPIAIALSATKILIVPLAMHRYPGNHIADINAQVITNLTNANGTADGTVDDVGASFDQGTLNNNFRELSDQVNNLKTVVDDMRTKFNSVLANLEERGFLASS